MTPKSISSFKQELLNANTEEDVKAVYASRFKIKYHTKYRHDLYHPNVLFEFKYNKNFESIKALSTVLAQSLYYIRRLKLGIVDIPLSPIICISDINESILTETVIWKKFYSSNKYQWNNAPSNPDEKLIADLSQTEEIKKIHVYKIQEDADYDLFSEKLEGYLADQTLLPADKKIINDINFVDVYDYWCTIFSKDVKNGLKTSKYFLCDIQEGKSKYKKDDGVVIFNFDDGKRIKRIIQSKYDYFWSIYEKVTDPDITRNIITKLDCLTEIKTRRFTGEFFTPPKFAKNALDYFDAVLGNNWWCNANLRIWDMAAGTGNLEWYIPVKSYHKIYLSTIYGEDVEYCKKLFPGTTCFKYDYLRDDVNNVFSGDVLFEDDWKLPENLRVDLKNPKLHWVVFLNPPFGTSQPGKLHKANYKSTISSTLVRDKMHKDDLGEVSRELFAQFILRIIKEFSGKTAHLGLFSKIKYLNSNNDQKFRDFAFNSTFEKGFIFSSVNFSNTSRNSQFPIGFLIWDLSKNKKISDQNIVLDIYDENVYKIGKKKIIIEDRKHFLNKWIERPKNRIVYPPFGSAVTIKENNKDKRDRKCDEFLGSFMCQGNDFQCQAQTALFSGPYASAGALSIIPNNFEKAMVIHAVRRIPKATWVNDRDQFMQPNRNLSDTFISDCVLWTLFSSSNETVSMRDVVYKNNTYQITNNFFPLKITEICTWDKTDKEIEKTIKQDSEDRFVANWINRQDLSKESKDVLHLGKRVYKKFYENLNKIETSKYKITWWDAGWWQIKRTLKEQNICNDLFEEFQISHNQLKEKLLPKIVDYGFISG